MLGALLAHALQPIDLAFHRLGDLLGEVTIGELRSVLAGDVVVAVAELLLDGFELLPKDILSLRLVDPARGVLPDPLAQGEPGEDLVHPSKDQLESRLDLDLFQHLHLLRQREVGRVSGEIGELAGIVDIEQP